MNISLNKAFKIRNLLKRKQEELNGLYRYHAPKVYDESIKEHPHRETNGLATIDIVNQIGQTHFLLTDLNIAIAKGNHEADVIITEINNVKDELKFIKSVIGDLRNATYKTETQNTVTGDMIIKTFRPFNDSKIYIDIEKQLSKRVLELEDRLAFVNAQDNVEIPDGLMTEIQGIIPGV